MKSVALIHTVKTVACSFDQNLREHLGQDVKIHNLWDDFLATDPNETGVFSVNNRNRLFQDIRSAEMTGADVIAVTCSTLTPAVSMIRPFVNVPLIAIDDAMGRAAAAMGNRILIFATAESTRKPLTQKLETEAAALGKTLCIDFTADAEAFAAMKAGEMERHDEILLKKAKTISDYDCVVLAQASMAHLERQIQSICGIPTLSSPRACMEQIRQALAE